LNEIKQSLASAPGVGTVEVHPTTGSVIVHYRRTPAHPGTFRKELVDKGHSSGLFELAPPDITGAAEMENKIRQEAEFLASRSELARTVVNAAEELNQAVKRATDNTVDLNVLVPGVLAVYTFLYAGAELSTPLWVTLGIFAFNSFVALHPPLAPHPGPS
jgi:cation transport ATPase